MIGMHVRIERPYQVQLQLMHQRGVAAHLLENRIDQDRFAARTVAQQIRIGGRLRVEQLAEDQHVYS